MIIIEKLGIEIGNFEIFFDSNHNGIELREVKKENIFNKRIYDFSKYKEYYENGGKKGNILTYRYSKNQLTILKLPFGYRLVGFIDTFIPKSSKIKNIYNKFKFSKKIIFRKGKFKNKKELINFLEEKLKEKEKIKFFINHFEEEVLKQFL